MEKIFSNTAHISTDYEIIFTNARLLSREDFIEEQSIKIDDYEGKSKLITISKNLNMKSEIREELRHYLKIAYKTEYKPNNEYYYTSFTIYDDRVIDFRGCKKEQDKLTKIAKSKLKMELDFVSELPHKIEANIEILNRRIQGLVKLNNDKFETMIFDWLYDEPNFERDFSTTEIQKYKAELDKIQEAIHKLREKRKSVSKALYNQKQSIVLNKLENSNYSFGSVNLPEPLIEKIKAKMPDMYHPKAGILY